MGASVLVIYLATLYGTYVPEWEFVVYDKDSILYGKIQTVSLSMFVHYVTTKYQVLCGCCDKMI